MWAITSDERGEVTLNRNSSAAVAVAAPSGVALCALSRTKAYLPFSWNGAMSPPARSAAASSPRSSLVPVGSHAGSRSAHHRTTRPAACPARRSYTTGSTARPRRTRRRAPAAAGLRPGLVACAVLLRAQPGGDEAAELASHQRVPRLGEVELVAVEDAACGRRRCSSSTARVLIAHIRLEQRATQRPEVGARRAQPP